MKILFKYATRSRPAWFKKTLEGYLNNLSGRHEHEFRITIDHDDAAMNNPEMLAYMAGKRLKVYVGPAGRSKIDVINADMDGAEFDILVVVSDDMEVKEKGFDDIIAQDMQRQFPSGFGALHYNDGKHGRDNLITLSIMNKALYDHLGYIYYPNYRSTWCDNEFTDVTKMLNCYWYCPRVIIEHAWMKQGGDETYKKNSGDYHNDKVIYETRKAAGFPNDIRDMVH